MTALTSLLAVEAAVAAGDKAQSEKDAAYADDSRWIGTGEAMAWINTIDRGDKAAAEFVRHYGAQVREALANDARYRWLRMAAKVSWNGYITYDNLLATDAHRAEMDAAVDVAIVASFPPGTSTEAIDAALATHQEPRNED